MGVALNNMYYAVHVHAVCIVYVYAVYNYAVAAQYIYMRS